MATRDTGGQQKATRTREETDEVEASVDTETAERHKEMGEDVDALLSEMGRAIGPPWQAKHKLAAAAAFAATGNPPRSTAG